MNPVHAGGLNPPRINATSLEQALRSTEIPEQLIVPMSTPITLEGVIRVSPLPLDLTGQQGFKLINGHWLAEQIALEIVAAGLLQQLQLRL